MNPLTIPRLLAIAAALVPLAGAWGATNAPTREIRVLDYYRARAEAFSEHPPSGTNRPLHAPTGVVDAILIRESDIDPAWLESHRDIVERAATLGVPLLVSPEAATNASRDAVYSFTLRGKNLERLGMLDSEAGGTPLPTVKSSVSHQAADGTFSLERVEVGLAGETFWIIRSGDTDEASGMTGIQLQTEW